MAGQDPLRRFGNSLQKVEVRKVSVRTADGSMKIAVDRVALVASFARRKDAGTATFVIGNAGLLRSFRIEQTKNGRPFSQKEIYDGASLKPNRIDFEYTPIDGAQMMQNFPTVEFDPRLRIGCTPLSIHARDLDGRIVDLREYTGQVVLLDFWAVWCIPSRREALFTAQMYRLYKADGFNVIGISLDDSKSALLEFAHTNDMTWRQIYDGPGRLNSVATRYKVGPIPFSVLIGRDGKIVDVDLRGAALETALKNALAKK